MKILWSDLDPAVDPTATFPLAGSPGSGDSFVLTFLSLIGQTYRLEWSDSLNPPSWSVVADSVPGTGNTLSITDPGLFLQAQRFYRVVVLPP